MTGENRKRNGADELQSAREALADARVLLERGSPRGAVTRAYYAAFHAARAVLLSRGLQVKTHSGLMQKFSEEFIKTGALAVRTKDTLAGLMEKRGVADYGERSEWTLLSEQVARELVAAANEFVDDMEAWLQEKWKDLTQD